MLDIRFVRENPDQIREMLRSRGVEYPLDQLLEIDVKRRSVISENQSLREKKNVVSKEISSLKRAKAQSDTQITKMKEITDRIAKLDDEIRHLDEKEHEFLSRLPNIPDVSVPKAFGEEGNVVIRSFGEPIQGESCKDHIDLGQALDLIDVARAAKVSGARFYYLRSDLVRLNYALIMLALEFLGKKNFTIVQPPYLLNRKALSGSIILSDFEDVIYKVDGEDLYLIATAEHAIAALHMEEIFNGDDLPLRYGGVSPCFRKEAGAHGRDTKGIFRVHQFEKVEQFIFCKPSQSNSEHELLLSNAEEFFRLLEIPHRVVLLCTGEMGKVASKTYDIEAWFPGQGKYREVVSCSNCGDYQARSLAIKYREKPHEPSNLVHTLNSTLVATERTLIAIMENNQQEDGSIIIPKALRSYMADRNRIEPKTANR